MTRRVHVLVCEPFAPGWLERLAGRVPEAVLAHHVGDVPAEALARAEVLYAGSRLPSEAEAPALRWLQLDTAGADHVAPGWRRDVVVTSIGGVSGRPLAEYVMFMVLGLAHRLPELVANARGRTWPADNLARFALFRPRAVAGTTMVVVGYGRLGRAIAELARPFGVRVVGVRRSAGEDLDVLGVERLHEALGEADWIVVATPLTPDTRGLLDAAAFAAVKPGAAFVNVGRGGVVDEDAMLAALDDGRLSGAAVDVFATEPLPAESPLWDDPRVLVTPHVAGLAPDYDEQVGELFAANLARYVAREPLVNVVDRDRGY